MAALIVVVLAVPAWAADEPIINVSGRVATPARLEVHVGELVRWRGAGDHQVHVELDGHPHAHEAVIRTGEVRAVFLRAGEHSYRGWRVGHENEVFQGAVVVREPTAPPALPPTCSSESSERICFEP